MRDRIYNLYCSIIAYVLSLQGVRCDPQLAEQVRQQAGFLTDNTMLQPLVLCVYTPVYRIKSAHLKGSQLVVECADVDGLPIVYGVDNNGKFTINFLDNPDGFGDRLFVGDCLNEVK